MYLLGFIQIWTDVQKRILHCCAQTSDILHELSVDNRRQLYSQPLQCNKKIDFTPASFSLISSAPSGVIFEDLISHIRTSSFLTRAQEGCLDPFHMRKPRPAQIATLKRIIISFKSFLHIYFWLLWERCISFSYTFKLNKLEDRRENRPRGRISNKNIFNPMFLSNGGPLVLITMQRLSELGPLYSWSWWSFDRLVLRNWFLFPHLPVPILCCWQTVSNGSLTKMSTFKSHVHQTGRKVHPKFSISCFKVSFNNHNSSQWIVNLICHFSTHGYKTS